MLSTEHSALDAARAFVAVADRAHAQLQAVESELSGQMTPDQLGTILAAAIAYGEAQEALSVAVLMAQAA